MIIWKVAEISFTVTAVPSLACQKNILPTYHSLKSISAVKSLTKADLNRKSGKYCTAICTTLDCDAVVIPNRFTKQRRDNLQHTWMPACQIKVCCCLIFVQIPLKSLENPRLLHVEVQQLSLLHPYSREVQVQFLGSFLNAHTWHTRTVDTFVFTPVSCMQTRVHLVLPVCRSWLTRAEPTCVTVTLETFFFCFFGSTSAWLLFQF